MERLQKVIANRGYCSRRKAEQLIIEGKVKVDGQIIKELGYQVDVNAKILIDDEEIIRQEKVYYLLNKPTGVISSAKDDKGRMTVVDLIDSKERIFPIGRLDYASSGLLLLTNDGELMNKIIHPSFQIEKVYQVKIDKKLSRETLNKIEKGIRIEDYITSPAKIRIIRENELTMVLEITIYEGKNREIRKMFEKVGADVLKLHRIKEANIELGDLASGEYRKLKPFEIKKLKDYLNNSNR